jgi:hypothetical protein
MERAAAARGRAARTRRLGERLRVCLGECARGGCAARVSVAVAVRREGGIRWRRLGRPQIGPHLCDRARHLHAAAQRPAGRRRRTRARLDELRAPPALPDLRRHGAAARWSERARRRAQRRLVSRPHRFSRRHLGQLRRRPVPAAAARTALLRRLARRRAARRRVAAVIRAGHRGEPLRRRTLRRAPRAERMG